VKIDYIDKKLHNGKKIIFLHLFPGILNILVIMILFHLSEYIGIFSLNLPYFMVIISIVPFQLGYLLYTSKMTTGTYKIGKIITYQNKSKFIEYIIFIGIIIAWAIFINRFLEPFEIIIRDKFFIFVPDKVAFRNINLTKFSKNELLFTGIFGIITNGILAPIIEELYFRGYLLSKINLSPKWAVVVNAILFSSYHFFSPWFFLSRLLMIIPIYYWTIKRNNIRFSLIAHLTANLYTNIRLLISILAIISIK